MDRTPDLIIPADNLPPGFAEHVERATYPPSAPLPAATAVLLRDSARGPEVLLLRRNRDAGFVPGAYVFPGGRVDPADADADLLRRVDGMPRMVEGLPEPGYWTAALREMFEETGVLIARHARGGPLQAGSTALRRWRDALLDDTATLLDVITALEARLDLHDVVPCAHWITPIAEPRRYDTRFFLAALPSGQEAAIDPREMSDACWLTPRAALDRFAAGRLPMVFPTVRTLQSIDGHDDVAAVLNAFRDRNIVPILPRLVRSGDGVGIVINEAGGTEAS